MNTNIIFAGYQFRLVAHIALTTDQNGNYAEYNPANRYENAQSLPLNTHGHKQFCDFNLSPLHGSDPALDQQGVYAICAPELKYIGRTQETLGRRFTQYGRIQPRNCFQRGQSTNCHINNEILEVSRAGESVVVYFHQTNDPQHKEAAILNSLNIENQLPPWNLSVPSLFGAVNRGGTRGKPLPKKERATTMKYGKDADSIRDYVIAQYFNPTRERNGTEVAVRASDVHNAMGFVNRVPNVCQVLDGKKLQEQGNAELVDRRGAPQGTTATCIYRLN